MDPINRHRDVPEASPYQDRKASASEGHQPDVLVKCVKPQPRWTHFVESGTLDSLNSLHGSEGTPRPPKSSLSRCDGRA